MTDICDKCGHYWKLHELDNFCHYILGESNCGPDWCGCVAKRTENMCMHCLEEGYWEDEDKCPKCAKL